MQEIVFRRYNRLKKESKTLPDLILIDGGKGQLGVAFSVLKKLGIENIPIVGLAKRLEEVFIPGLKHHNQLVRIVLDLSYSEELEMKLIDLQLIIRSKKGIQIYLSHHLNLYKV